MLFWFAFFRHSSKLLDLEYSFNAILIQYDSLYFFIDKDADWPHEEKYLELVWFLDAKPNKQWMLCHLTVLNTYSVCFLRFTYLKVYLHFFRSEF